MSIDFTNLIQKLGTIEKKLIHEEASLVSVRMEIHNTLIQAQDIFHKQEIEKIKEKQNHERAPSMVKKSGRFFQLFQI